ncbi:MAG: radical SAM protein [Candidatus Omnitrophota bacterium]
MDAGRLLLINAPSDKKVFFAAQAPVGILSIAACLQRAGFAAAVADLNVSGNWQADLRRLLNSYRPGVVGISSVFSNRGDCLGIASITKSFNRDITVVAGGPHPTIAPEEYVCVDIDYVVPFESERIIPRFIASGGRCAVPGMIDCAKGEVAKQYAAIKRDPVNNLDELPFPDYRMVNLSRYQYSMNKRRPLVCAVTSRGCPAGCAFCSQGVFGRQWRGNSAEYVADLMEWIEKECGGGEIIFEDDNFTFDVERIFRLCRLIRSKKLKITWQASGVRVDRISKELLRSMKEAGCWKIAFGPEVGDDESLRLIGKGLTLDDYRRAARWCRETGIIYFCYFVMGFSFQDEQKMRGVIDFAKELDPLIMTLNKLMPFPGTEVYDKARVEAMHRRYLSFSYSGGDRTLEKMFKRAHLEFYLRPWKLARIAAVAGLRQFSRLAAYGFNLACSK